LTGPYQTDIPQMTSKFVEIVPLVHRQGNSIPFAAMLMSACDPKRTLA